VGKIVRDCETGAIGEYEAFWRICQATAVQPPDAIAELISADWLLAIKDACDDVSGYSESEWLSRTPTQPVEAAREIWDALVQWRQYFAENSRDPPGLM